MVQIGLRMDQKRLNIFLKGLELHCVFAPKIPVSFRLGICQMFYTSNILNFLDTHEK